MRTLARLDSRFGEILIIEDIATGARRYYEGTAFQSHALNNGESCFTYVHIMSELLRKKKRVLLLGCGGGSLATMLYNRGVDVTLVDHNPQSFDVARTYFGLPDAVACIATDFREHLAHEDQTYDGIGIDVGSAAFDFQDEFDPDTCRLIRRALTANGVAVTNMMAAHDVDPTADVIAATMGSPERPSWIFDQLGLVERNAVVVAGRRGRPRLDPLAFPEDLRDELATWSIRTPRPRRDTVIRAFPIDRSGGRDDPSA